MVNGWRKVRESKFGNNISIVFSKGFLSVELFRDSAWGKTDNMNVIIRDKRKKTHESALGKDIHVEYCASESQAKKYASAWMKEN